LSREKAPESDEGVEITTADLFGSIPKPIDVDPFEGIDMKGINISGVGAPDAVEDIEEISQVNPLEGIDLGDISILKKRGRISSRDDKEIDAINSLSGIDLKYIGIEPRRSEKVAEAPPEKTVDQKQIEFPTEETADRDPVLIKKISKAYRYAEINRIRDNVVKDLQEKKQKSIMITSPHDDAGNTFLVSVLGFNVAYFTDMSVLLLDLNMRRPKLHTAFGVSLADGFNEIAMGLLDWRDAIKDTGLADLKMITAGQPSNDLSFFLNRAFIKEMINDIKDEFDLVFLDTSPVLTSNINNVDPTYLSTVADMVILVVQDKITTKAILVEAVDTIKDGGGEIDGIVYNRQF